MYVENVKSAEIDFAGHRGSELWTTTRCKNAHQRVTQKEQFDMAERIKPVDVSFIKHYIGTLVRC